MNSFFLKKDKALVIELTEEIDHHTTEKIRRKIDDDITRYMPRKVIFDFNKVSFMDSAGIGMIIGRYKMMNMLGGIVEMKNVKRSIRKIFEMSGVTKIIQIIDSYAS
jgi:stage II sporulation protein AA (anti-sigma F factor antagonist)